MGHARELLEKMLSNYKHMDVCAGINIDLNKLYTNGIWDFYSGISRSTGEHLYIINRRRFFLLGASDEYEIRSLMDIFSIWATLRHKNVVKLVGYILDDMMLPRLVIKQPEYANVLLYLKNNPSHDVREIVNIT